MAGSVLRVQKKYPTLGLNRIFLPLIVQTGLKLKAAP